MENAVHIHPAVDNGVQHNEVANFAGGTLACACTTDTVTVALGGQTALNTAVALYENGALDRYDVELIGADFDAIQRGEDRQRFKDIVAKVGGESARSRVCFTMDEVRETVAELGLPADLGIRLVLHAGPVFTFADPVLGRSTCLGSHISRAARIEPITPPGQVFASQEFAALCSADDLAAVSFEFLGRIHTGRLFDEAPLYRLDRRRREL